MMAAYAIRPEGFSDQGGRGKTITRYKPGEIIFKQGEGPAGAVYYLQYGNVKKSVVSDQGREAVVGMLEPGLFFGTACLDGPGGTDVDATAVKASMGDRDHQGGDECHAQRQARIRAVCSGCISSILTSRLEADKIDLMFNSGRKATGPRCS